MTEFHDRRTGNVVRITPRVPQPSSPVAGDPKLETRLGKIENRARAIEAEGGDANDIVNYVHMRPTDRTMHLAEFDLNMRPTVPAEREHLYDQPGIPNVSREGGKIRDYGNVIPD